MKFYRIFLLFLSVVLGVMISTTVLAQQPKKIPLYIDSSTPDNVGRDFVYQLKEQINKSSSYFITYNANNALFTIDIITVSDDNNNSATAYSIALQAGNKNTLVSNAVGVCGQNALSSCAARALAGLDQDITQVVKQIIDKNNNN